MQRENKSFEKPAVAQWRSRTGLGLNAETHGNSSYTKSFLNLNLKRNGKEDSISKRAKKKNMTKETGRLWEGQQLITHTTQPFTTIRPLGTKPST